MSSHYALTLERAHILRSTRRKSERAMRQHRTFCLPESEQAIRQARQEPDGTTVEARDGGLSGSGNDSRIRVQRQHTSDVRAGPAEGT